MPTYTAVGTTCGDFEVYLQNVKVPSAAAWPQIKQNLIDLLNQETSVPHLKVIDLTLLPLRARKQKIP